MLLTTPSLIPSKLLASGTPLIPSGTSLDEINQGRKAIQDRMQGKERPAPKPVQNKIWNWTDTRGDRFAVAFAPTLAMAQHLARKLAYVHACEIHQPESEAARKRLWNRINVPPVREITRQEYETLCREQSAARGAE